ncbi:GspE/PulE family protein [Cysteiniphilum litorale]|uniref:GspE/PulE family protein n=1 Tax=Cysteiniphilum litorale TaxID=2056700 RepID=UPI003F885F06
MQIKSWLNSRSRGKSIPKLETTRQISPSKSAIDAKQIVVTQRNLKICNSFDELNIKAEKLLYCDPSHTRCFSKEEQSQFLFVQHILSDGQRALAVIQSINLTPTKELADKLAKYKTEAQKEYDLKAVKTIIARAVVLSDCLQKIKSSDLNHSKEALAVEFDNLLAHAIAQDASDIHFRVRGQVCEVSLRVHDEIKRCAYANYDAQFANKMMRAMYNTKGVEGQKEKMFDPGRMQQTVFERVINQRRYRIRFASHAIESPNIKDVALSQSYVVVMRILSTDKTSIKSFEDLGYSQTQIKYFNDVLKLPHGGILFSGTTGSGKSTALTTLISNFVRVTAGTKKFYSVESPVEYIIDGVDQLAVHDSVQFSEADITHKFNLALKQMVRLDPDMIYCNEIRDEGTAKFSQKAIQSGHVFFSTLHAQDAISTIERLCGIGIDRDVVCSLNFLQLIVYQTLVQTLCSSCALTVDEAINQNKDYMNIKQTLLDVIKAYALPERMIHKVRIRNVSGCEHCDHSGVVGRTVIAEFLKPNANILQNIRKGDLISAYRAWRSAGGMTIKEDALIKVFRGQICPYSVEYKVGALDSEIEDELVEREHLKNILNKAMT